MDNGWIDVTVGIRSGMITWPGDPAVVLERNADMDKGDHNNVSQLSTGVHVGTHVDAPLHFIREGTGVETLPLQALVGPARVIEIADPVAIQPAEIDEAGIQQGERVLFKTRNSKTDWPNEPFKTDYVAVNRAGAEYLAARGVKTVGVDYLSVAGFKHEGAETHVALLSAGVCVIEGLVLRDVAPGYYDMVCLPMKLVGSDGAPARVILRPRTEE